MRIRRHPHETDRSASLRTYDLLDAAPVPELDALTRLTARLLGTPVAMINLVDADRQYAVSSSGSDRASTSRSESICSDVVASGQPLVVDDLTRVRRYAQLPTVGGPDGFRAYAGMPVIGRDGLPLGVLCAVDTLPRVFTEDQLAALHDLACQVTAVLELRRCDVSAGLTAAAVVPEALDPSTLRAALDAGQFVPYFQPLVDLRTGSVVGVELLVRWDHPTRGLLAPAAFLPALDAGLLSQWTGHAMLESGCALVVRLAAAGVQLPDGIALNMPSKQLVTPGAAARVLAVLDRHGLPGSVLTAEITETAEIQDVALAHRELTALREAGVRVVADDFGVGWSNLARLLQLPMCGLKIDRELVTNLVGDRVREHMVAGAVALGRAMGLDVVAEGVETEAVRDRLLELGCTRGQGWLFSPALPAAELMALVTRVGADGSAGGPARLTRPARPGRLVVQAAAPGAVPRR